MIGKQGPIIHISSCIGNVLSRLFLKYHQNEGKKREILSASCASGLSFTKFRVVAAFGTPIG